MTDHLSNPHIFNVKPTCRKEKPVTFKSFYSDVTQINVSPMTESHHCNAYNAQNLLIDCKG